MKNIFFIILMISTTTLFAQMSDSTALARLQYIDVVKMESGSLYQGHIKKITETTIDMQILGGFVVHLNQKDIRIIEQRCLNCNTIAGYNSIERYNFREKGLYGQVSSSLISGYDYNNYGFSVNAVAGKMQRRMLGYGIGLGLYSFRNNSDGQQKFIPVFGEVRSYLRKKMTTPFVSIKTGYGFLIDKKAIINIWEQPIASQHGGLFFNPTFGYRFGANDVNFVMDVGLVVQHSKKNYEPNENEVGRNWRKYNFQRWQIGLGILF